MLRNPLEYINNHTVVYRGDGIHYTNICDKIIFYIRFYCFRKVTISQSYFRTIAKIFKIPEMKVMRFKKIYIYIAIHTI